MKNLPFPVFLGVPPRSLLQKHTQRCPHHCSWGMQPQSHPATLQTGTQGCVSSRGWVAVLGFYRSTSTVSPCPRCHRPRCWGGNRGRCRRSHAGPQGLVLVIAPKTWAHLPSCNPKHTVGCGDPGGWSVLSWGSWVPDGSPSPSSGMYSMHSTGDATGKDFTVRGTARLREKISTCPPVPSCPPPTCMDREGG